MANIGLVVKDIIKEEKYFSYSQIFFNLYESLATTLQNIGDNDDAIAALNDWRQYIQVIQDIKPNRYISQSLILWHIISGMIYADAGRVVEAEKLLNEAEKIIGETGMTMRYITKLKYSYFHLYFNRKQYSEALSAID